MPDIYEFTYTEMDRYSSKRTYFETLTIERVLNLQYVL